MGICVSPSRLIIGKGECCYPHGLRPDTIQPLGLEAEPIFPEHSTTFQIPEEDEGMLAKMKDRWLLGKHFTVLLHVLPCYCLCAEVRGGKITLNMFLKLWN